MRAQMDEDQIQELTERVVRETVKQIFLTMGVNTDDDNALIGMQKDFAHLRAWRESMDTVKSKSLGAAVVFIVTGGLGLLWLAIKPH